MFNFILQRTEKIREEYGLKEKTIVISIPDLTDIEPEMFGRISEVLSHSEAVSFRDAPECPESHDAYYNYIMCVKASLVTTAIDRGYAHGMVAWFDFGFNHGGEYLSNPDDFAFTWYTDLPDKMNLFMIEDDNGQPIFDVVKSMKVYVAGCLIIGPAQDWQMLKYLVGQAVDSLADCGMADDDQTILLMACRKEPESFNCVPVSTWFASLPAACNKKFQIGVDEKKELHKQAKRSAQRAWRQGNYAQSVKYFFKYMILKISGK